MSRIARVVVPGEPHHCIQRGNRRAAIFHADEERRAYLRLLEEYAGLHRVAIWAYCLMTNHIHLVAVPAREDAIAAMLRGVHTVYAMQYNARHRCVGHLFQGRFKSCPLDSDHAWAAVRYVERNPVRAGMVPRAEDYPWSSAAAHCGLRRDPVLSPGFPPKGVIQDWAAWLSAPGDEELQERIRDATRLGRPCGSESYTRELERTLHRPLLPEKAGRKPKAISTDQGDLFL